VPLLAGKPTRGLVGVVGGGLVGVVGGGLVGVVGGGLVGVVGGGLETSCHQGTGFGKEPASAGVAGRALKGEDRVRITKQFSIADHSRISVRARLAHSATVPAPPGLRSAEQSRIVASCGTSRPAARTSPSKPSTQTRLREHQSIAMGAAHTG